MKTLGLDIGTTTVSAVVLEDGKSWQTLWKRRCFAIEKSERLTVLARYAESRNIAYGYVKDAEGSYTAFSGLGCMNGDALRPILELAGVHRYSDTADCAVYANDNMLGVYHRQERDIDLNLSESDDGVWIDLFENTEYRAKRNSLHVPYNGQRAKLLVRKDLL